MKRLFLMLIGIAFLTQAPTLAAQAFPNSRSDIAPLNNRDVLIMLDKRVPVEGILKTIESSACTFDTFPPVMQDLSRRGVPGPVLRAMLEAPYGPSTTSRNDDELGEEPIYHYAEHLKHLGLLTPSSVRRSAAFSPRRERARRSTMRRRNM